MIFLCLHQNIWSCFHWNYSVLSENETIPQALIIYRGYPAKRALSAMRKQETLDLARTIEMPQDNLLLTSEALSSNIRAFINEYHSSERTWWQKSDVRCKKIGLLPFLAAIIDEQQMAFCFRNSDDVILWAPWILTVWPCRGAYPLFSRMVECDCNLAANQFWVY